MTYEAKPKRFWKIVIAVVVIGVVGFIIVSVFALAVIRHRRQKAQPEVIVVPN